MSGKASGYQKFFRDARKNAESSMTPEQLVLRQLADRENQKRRQKRSKRRPPPVFATVLLLISVGAAAIGIMTPNAFDSISDMESGVHSAFQSLGFPMVPRVSFGFFGKASAAEDKTAAKKTEDKKAEAKTAEAKESSGAEKSAASEKDAGEKSPSASSANAAKSQDAGPDVRQWTPEEMSFFKRLNDRKIELDRREAELAKLEEELQKQRSGIEDKIKQLETMRAEISTTLKGRVEQDQEKVAKLVDVYSNMKPASASKVIETLNEDLAMTILDKMKKKNAAEILNMMTAAKAKKLSEMLTGYRQPASTGENSADAKSEVPAAK